jgi:hypothetical protein
MAANIKRVERGGEELMGRWSLVFEGLSSRLGHDGQNVALINCWTIVLMELNFFTGVTEFADISLPIVDKSTD